jgi:transposase InsO family protein
MGEIINMKENIIKRYIAKKINRKETAKLLGMHTNAVSRLVTRYKKERKYALTPKKPGPKSYNVVHNKTPSWIEDIVVMIANDNLDKGPVLIAEKLFDERKIELNSTTVWRILKRRKIRYTQEYKRWIREEPKLYCLDKPGLELQLDACYPFGRQRQLVSFDAIDDCSRYIVAKLYKHEDAESAIDFVKYLIKKAPFQIKRIRVDNRYGAKFKEFCNSIDIEVIQNDPYHPEQNGKIERFHRTVKNEFFFKKISFHDSMEKIEYKYQQWIFHYNTQRKHGGYKMERMTPKQKIALTLFLSLSNINFKTPQKVTSTMQQSYIQTIVATLL